MTVDEVLPRLDAVRRNSRGYTARCPAHDDRTPSLSVRDGERSILLKCWAGCRIEDITAAVGLTVRDLFHDQTQNTREWKQAQRKRQAERDQREAIRNVHGLTIDLQREADGLIRSARHIDISRWSHEQLDAVLNKLADAYDVQGYDDE